MSSKKSRTPRNQNRTDRPAGRVHRARTRSRRIKAAEFKAVCLELMDRVKRTGEEFVITKRGQPVAKLTPIRDDQVRPFVGRSRGVITASAADLLAPVAPDWDIGADL